MGEVSGVAFTGLRFTGLAAVWDRVDRTGDVIRRGAVGAARRVPLLWQHRGAPVGSVDVCEDAVGLCVAGVVEDEGVAALVRQGALAGLSIGYRPIRTRQGAWRELLDVELVEVSLVAVPMQPGARVMTIGAAGGVAATG